MKTRLALWDFNTDLKGEISFVGGDIIVVTHEDEGGEWAVGQLQCLDGSVVTGWFPITYTAEYEDINETDSSGCPPEVVVMPGLPRSWKKTVPANILNSLSQKDLLRQQRIYEIIKTEDDYVKDIELLISNFVKPFRKSKACKQPDLLFANIDNIVMINIELRAELFERRLESVVVNKIGDIFLKLFEYFKMYTQYCGNYDIAQVALEKEMKNKSFLKLMRAAEANAACHGVPLIGFLIKPVQRICKYSLLLREVMDSTSPDHEDFESLANALSKISSVVDIVNEHIRSVDLSHKILEIQRRLGESIEILIPSRRFLREEVLSERRKDNSFDERIVFLFSDLFLVASKEKTSKSVFGNSNRDELTIVALYPLVEISVKGDSTLAFTITDISGAQHVFVCPTDSSREAWLDDIWKFKSSKHLSRSNSNGSTTSVDSVVSSKSSPVLRTKDSPDLKKCMSLSLSSPSSKRIFKLPLCGVNMKQPKDIPVEKETKASFLNLPRSTLSNPYLTDKSPVKVTECLLDPGCQEWQYIIEVFSVEESESYTVVHSCNEFLKLHQDLLKHFSDDADSCESIHTLPSLPDPTELVNEVIARSVIFLLNSYVSCVVYLPKISESDIVEEFFSKPYVMRSKSGKRHRVFDLPTLDERPVHLRDSRAMRKSIYISAHSMSINMNPPQLSNNRPSLSSTMFMSTMTVLPQ